MDANGLAQLHAHQVVGGHRPHPGPFLDHLRLLIRPGMDELGAEMGEDGYLRPDGLDELQRILGAQVVGDPGPPGRSQGRRGS